MIQVSNAARLGSPRSTGFCVPTQLITERPALGARFYQRGCPGARILARRTAPSGPRARPLRAGWHLRSSTELSRRREGGRAIDTPYHEHRLRVRYAETDQMGVVHHANYLLYVEESRTRLMADRGCSYAEFE